MLKMLSPSPRTAVKTVIQYRPDATITLDEDRQLRRLLFACFPHEPVFFTRRYIKRSPAHRWLVLTPWGEIVGHAAIHDKILGTGFGELTVGGIAEVCVSSQYRGRGLSKQLMDEMHAWLKARGIPFALLFGQPKVYAASGYVAIDNEIRADNSLARHWNPFYAKPLIKRLGNAPWPDGVIDLRGPTF